MQVDDVRSREQGAYSWDQVRTAVERFEGGVHARQTARVPASGDREPGLLAFFRRVLPFTELAGGVALGVLVAVMALVTNYLLFVWILHVNFSF